MKQIVKHKGAMREEHLTLLGMTLGRHTLADAERKLGPAPNIHMGHEGVMLCYRSNSKSDDTLVTFTAEDDGDQFMFNFQIISGREPFRGRANCKLSALVSREVSTKSGLRLGLRSNETRTIWGDSMTEIENHQLLEYEIEREQKQGEEIVCDVTFSSMGSRFSDSNLSWLMIAIGGERYTGPCQGSATK